MFKTSVATRPFGVGDRGLPGKACWGSGSGCYSSLNLLLFYSNKQGSLRVSPLPPVLNSQPVSKNVWVFQEYLLVGPDYNVFKNDFF